MKKVIIFSLLTFFLTIPYIYATLTYPTSPKGTPRISKQYVIPEIKVEKVEGYDHIVIHGLYDLNIPGEPVLPFKTVRLLLPLDQELKDVEVIPEQKTDLVGQYNIIYGKKPIPLSWASDPELREKIPSLETVRDEAVYSSSEEYPGKLYSVVSTQVLRGYKILVVNLFPVQYIPKTGEVYYFKKINVNAYTDPIPTDLIRSKVKATFRALSKDKVRAEKSVDNPEETSTYTSQYLPSSYGVQTISLVDPTEDWDYIIITNNTLSSAFQGLVDWKNANGIKTKIVKVEDIYQQYTGEDNQSKIRNFIKDAYTNWGIEYVLLGGDGDKDKGDNIIPTRYFFVDLPDIWPEFKYIPADMYYSNLDGSFNSDNDGKYGEPSDGCDIDSVTCEVDLYSEVYVGRTPVDSVEQINNFVSKTIAYEQSTDPYLKKALMLGEFLGWSGPANWGLYSKEEIKHGSSIHGYTTEGIYKGYNVDFLYDKLYPGCYNVHDPDCWQKSELISKIENNISLINHLGHAAEVVVMKLYIEDVDALTNDKYFFAYSQGCHAGAFDEQDCVAEHFVTSKHGAFAVVMNSRYGWGSLGSTDGPSQRYDREFFDAIFGEGISELGRANQDSKEDNIGALHGRGELPRTDFPAVMRFCYYEINLFGDPAVKLKTDFSSPQADITSPMQADKVEPVGIIDIRGYAKEGSKVGSTFKNYKIEHGTGMNPVEWSSDGVTLVNGGLIPVTNGKLATIDSSFLKEGLNTIRLQTKDQNNIITEERIVVKVIPFLPTPPNQFFLEKEDYLTVENNTLTLVDIKSWGFYSIVINNNYYEVKTGTKTLDGLRISLVDFNPDNWAILFIVHETSSQYFLRVDGEPPQNSTKVGSKTVTLIDVESSGAVLIDIDGNQHTINGTKTVEGLRISVVDYRYADIPKKRWAVLDIQFSFGKPTPGKNFAALPANYIAGTIATLGDTVTVTKISFYGNGSTTRNKVKFAIYNASGLLKVYSNEITIDNTLKWWEAEVSPGVELRPGYYEIMVWSDKPLNVSYDQKYRGGGYYTRTYGNWPNPIPGWNFVNSELSIYATYTLLSEGMSMPSPPTCYADGTGIFGICYEECGASIECNGTRAGISWCDGYTKKTCSSTCKHSEINCKNYGSNYICSGGKCILRRGGGGGKALRMDLLSNSQFLIISSIISMIVIVTIFGVLKSFIKKNR